MIVKNEAKNLKRLFASLNQWIDYYVISDTGSTDDTIETIIELGKFYQIPGVIVKNDWVNFAYNRNQALEEAIREKEAGRHNSKWILIIDADEEFFVFDEKWKAHLQEGISYTTYKKVNGIAVKHPFLIWIPGQKFVWEGAVHNYLVNLNGKTRQQHTNEVYIKYNHFEGAKSQPFKDYREKALNDISLLLEELKGKELLPKNVHRFYQLGFLFRVYGDMDSAILYLKKVAEFKEASKDVRYISLIFIIKILIKDRADAKAIQACIKKSILINANRLEAYYYNAVLYRRLGNFSDALLELEKAEEMVIGETSFFYYEEDIYTWKIKYELAFVYFQLKEYVKAEKYILILTKNSFAPKEEQKFLFSLLERIKNDN